MSLTGRHQQTSHDDVKGGRVTIQPPPPRTIALVGSRTTTHRNARGRGISTFRVDACGQWHQIAEYSITNPTFLAADRARHLVHTVHGDGTEISTFNIDVRTGTLSLIGTQSTGGQNPAHLAFTPDRRHMIVVNHSSGSVVSFPVQQDGTLGPLRSCLELTGEPGPHRTDQTGSKPHQVVFDPSGRFLLVPDKGLDTVFICRIDDAGALGVHGSARTRQGAGPRHIAFHPHLPVAYAIDELSSTVTVFDWNTTVGKLVRRQILPTTDPFDVDDTRAAEIVVHPTGRFVYASNRRGAGDHTPGGPDPDTVAVFETNPADGSLAARGIYATGGIRPRHVVLDPSAARLYVANERSNSITALATSDAGRLSPSETVALTGSPVCIELLELQ
jgi:6-phosphogluconolactonase